jgi:ABC-2 type transport system ATP-binding protein
MDPIEIRNLSKRFGDVAAVHDLSFDVAAGRVTGFLGPNGAGKTTTLRALLGLVRPSSGTATFAGRCYDQLEHPSASVGRCSRTPPFTRGAPRATTCVSWRRSASTPAHASTRC